MSLLSMPPVRLRRAADEVLSADHLERMEPTVAHQLRWRFASTPERPALRHPRGDGEDWAGLTWGEVGTEATRLAAGLVSLGLEPGDRVALVAGTRWEWVVVDFAVMIAGGATTTVYPTTIADEAAYILGDAGCRLAVVEDETQLAKLRAHRGELPAMGRIVLIDGEPGEDDADVVTLDALRAAGDALLAADPQVVERRIDATRPEDLATLIYTSGTTGRPKGVRLLHGNWIAVIGAIVAIDVLDEDDVQLLWLPMAHAFGKILTSVAVQLGMETAIDGRVERIVPNLAVVRPTFMGAAPRIFEKAYGALMTQLAAGSPVKARIATWSLGVGRAAFDELEAGRDLSPVLRVKLTLADRLVLSKVRERFGGRVRVFLSGSAPLNTDVARFFGSTGMLVVEGYGMTETTAAATLNRPGSYRCGTVGWPLPGTELRVADDGELLVRGPQLMAGYHHNPEATAQALDAEGWLHTGDVAEVDEAGYVRITDRKSELFKTSNGKYVAPAVLESRFKGICPYASNIAVHGANRHFVTALITLDVPTVRQWAERTEAPGLLALDDAALLSSPQVRALVQESVYELNATLNPWEQVKKFTVLERELSIDRGEVTPSMKLRRKVVFANHQAELDRHYGDA